MKHLAAYLLLGLGGNTSPSKANIKEVLDSVGIEADDERLDKLLAELKDKDIGEVRDNLTLESPILFRAICCCWK
jgi:large subunit ribosomal protein LP2